MRIAMVASRYPYGGAEQVPMLLVQGMEARHEMFFITGGGKDDAYQEEGHRRIVIEFPQTTPFCFHYYNPSLVRKLKAHLRRIKPDVVHFHSITNRTFSAASLLVSNDYPTVWSLHDVWSLCVWSKPHPPLCERMTTGCKWCPRMPGLSLVNRWIKEFFWQRADFQVILCAAWMKKFFVHSAIGQKPAWVIPNGVELGRFENLDRQRVRRQHGIPSEAHVVLFVGNMLLPQKGHRELLEVARRIVSDQQDVWFLFVGHHHETEKGGHPRVIVTGPVDPVEIPNQYAAADIFAFPSHVEYAPLVILEAMAAGLPQVSCRVGGIPEQVVEAETGFLVETGDEASLEREIRKLLDDDELRRRMGRASRRRLEENFTLHRQVEQTEAVYRGGISQRRSSRPSSSRVE